MRFRQIKGPLNAAGLQLTAFDLDLHSAKSWMTIDRTHGADNLLAGSRHNLVQDFPSGHYGHTR